MVSYGFILLVAAAVQAASAQLCPCAGGSGSGVPVSMGSTVYSSGPSSYTSGPASFSSGPSVYSAGPAVISGANAGAIAGGSGSVAGAMAGASASSGSGPFLQNGVWYEEGCCPGPVIEKEYVINRPVTQQYVTQDTINSRQCEVRPAGVDQQVTPSSYETAENCQTQETVVQIPTRDVETVNTPLCKQTCVTNEFLITIPIRETTCTSSPLCQQTVRAQDNMLTTISKKTSCAKQQCSQNTITETPVYETVCQDYAQTVNKVDYKTTMVPEKRKTCEQLPPYPCYKPVSDSSSTGGVTITPYTGAPAIGSAAASGSPVYFNNGGGNVVSAATSAAAAAAASSGSSFGSGSFYPSAGAAGSASASGSSSFYPSPASSSSPCSCQCY